MSSAPSISSSPANAPGPLIDDAERARVQRRTLLTVMLAQILGGAGLAAGVTVGALIAADLLGGEAVAGLPAALTTLGAAATAYLMGRVARRRGRRLALGFGFLAGAAGAAGVVIATVLRDLPLLFTSLLIYGAGSATNLQARYAGTDLALPEHRGRAASMALTWTTIGAVVGPSMVAVLGELAVGAGLPRLTGPFVLASVAYAAAGATLLILLRPDPLLLARRIEAQRVRSPAAAGGTAAPVAGAGRRTVIAGGALLIGTQITMVAIMTMTPVAMHAHHHDLAAIGLVIGAHIAAMYLPSPISGLLVDRWGRVPTALTAAGVLLLAGAWTAAARGDSFAGTMIGLALLGLGWNLGLVAGTALIVDGTTPAERPHTQGMIDVLVALAGAGAGASSGLVAAAFGYQLLSIGSGLIGLALLPLIVRLPRPGR